jgi:hypothetical protein
MLSTRTTTERKKRRFADLLLPEEKIFPLSNKAHRIEKEKRNSRFSPSVASVMMSKPLLDGYGEIRSVHTTHMAAACND